MLRFNRTVLLGSLACVAVAGCEEPPPGGPQRSLKSHPKAFDRMMRLRKRELFDTNVVATHQAIVCETGRLIRVFGDREFTRRMVAVKDSIARLPVDARRRNEVDSLIVMESYGIDGAVCDSLNAIADREDPIRKDNLPPPESEDSILKELTRP